MMMAILHLILNQKSMISFPAGPTATEEIVLRWTHFIAGFIWIGVLYFFNLVSMPMMKELDAPVRTKVYPVMMPRAMWWFRWSALVTVLAGLRYFMIILKADASNAGNPALEWRWLGLWFLVWLVAYAILYVLQMPFRGALDNGWLRAVLMAVVIVIASCIVLRVNANSQSSNSHLSISIGGGLGLVMLLNAWGIVWRVQKRLIAAARESATKGTPMPPETERLMRWSFIAARTAFWISIPMLFFMGAADHYPFLSSITD